MAKSTVTGSYIGRAETSVSWDALVRIFNVIWGEDAHGLPKFPKVIGHVYGKWWDAQGVEHDAASLKEMACAYEERVTARISFSGALENTADCDFEYLPKLAKAGITVRASDEATSERIINAVRQEFPLVSTRVFISYDTREILLAEFVQTLLEKRLPPGTEVFVAKRDINPGANPMKVMLEQNLLQAKALIAMCSNLLERVSLAVVGIGYSVGKRRISIAAVHRHRAG